MLIQKSEWHPGMRLPAVPELASRFQVHRLTVLKALAGLKRTGWVQTVTGRGSFVADHLPEAPALRDPENFPFEGSSLKVREHELGPWLGETLGLAQNRSVLSFSANFPPADLLPGEALRRLHLQTMKELGAEAWAYGAAAGYPGYLEAIAQWLANEGEPIPDGWGIRSVPGRPGRAGPGAGIPHRPRRPGAGGKSLLRGRPGPHPDPGPGGGAGAGGPQRHEHRAAGLACCRRATPSCCFTVPTFHNPTGLTFGRTRRERILALTKTYGVPVVEDDTYGDLRFIGARIPSCRSLPGADHVIQLGSFSKSLAAGLRLGYIIAPNRVLEPAEPGAGSAQHRGAHPVPGGGGPLPRPTAASGATSPGCARPCRNAGTPCWKPSTPASRGIPRSPSPRAACTSGWSCPRTSPPRPAPHRHPPRARLRPRALVLPRRQGHQLPAAQLFNP